MGDLIAHIEGVVYPNKTKSSFSNNTAGTYIRLMGRYLSNDTTPILTSNL